MGEKDDKEYDWVQRVTDLYPQKNGDEFYLSISLSNDGSTIAIDGPSYTQNLGYACIYYWNYTGQTWLSDTNALQGQ